VLMMEQLKAVVNVDASLEVRRGLKEYLLEKVLVAAATAAMSQGVHGATVLLTEVEHIKWEAGLALGKGGKASTYDIVHGLRHSSNKELANHVTHLNAGRCAAAHPCPNVGAKVAAVLSHAQAGLMDAPNTAEEERVPDNTPRRQLSRHIELAKEPLQSDAAEYDGGAQVPMDGAVAACRSIGIQASVAKRTSRGVQCEPGDAEESPDQDVTQCSAEGNTVDDPVELLVGMVETNCLEQQQQQQRGSSGNSRETLLAAQVDCAAVKATAAIREKEAVVMMGLAGASKPTRKLTMQLSDASTSYDAGGEEESSNDEQERQQRAADVAPASVEQHSDNDGIGFSEQRKEATRPAGLVNAWTTLSAAERKLLAKCLNDGMRELDDVMLAITSKLKHQAEQACC